MSVHMVWKVIHMYTVYWLFNPSFYSIISLFLVDFQVNYKCLNDGDKL